MRVRFAPLAALLLLVPLACSKDDPAAPTGPETVLPLEARFPIDGVVPDLAAVGTVRQVNVTLRDAVGQGAEVAQTTLRWAVANDERAVYLAALWFDPSWNHDFTFEDGPVDFDGLRLLFDDAATGTLDLGDDSRTVIAALSGSQYVDAHVANPGEDETDHVGDGFAKLHYDEAQGLCSAEFLIPLADDAHGEDGPLDAASRYNLMVMQHVRLATLEGDVGTAYPMETGTASWPRLDLAEVVVTDRPAIPSGLDGLLVFISDHEEPLGEIYSFDPATGVTARVSTLPALFKDNVSLSHDRRRVAFHGAPSREAVGEYEIYTLDIDGTNLRQLTDNAITDGHPAWSPGDSLLAFASYRGGAGASIILCDTLGTERGDLTPDTASDNDPEFLPDGRILFKTSRYRAEPEVRIAVMDADGGNVVELSTVTGGSDHDPAGDGDWVYFERFGRPTDYSTDPESGFVGWDLVRVAPDGTGEQVLMADGWINWLPVPSPDGRAVAYLKGFGQTAVHVMSPAGQDLGRFVPDQSRVRYLDWK